MPNLSAWPQCVTVSQQLQCTSNLTSAYICLVGTSNNVGSSCVGDRLTERYRDKTVYHRAMKFCTIVYAVSLSTACIAAHLNCKDHFHPSIYIIPWARAHWCPIFVGRSISTLLGPAPSGWECGCSSDTIPWCRPTTPSSTCLSIDDPKHHTLPSQLSSTLQICPNRQFPPHDELYNVPRVTNSLLTSTFVILCCQRMCRILL